MSDKQDQGQGEGWGQGPQRGEKPVWRSRSRENREQSGMGGSGNWPENREMNRAPRDPAQNNRGGPGSYNRPPYGERGGYSREGRQGQGFQSRNGQDSWEKRDTSAGWVNEKKSGYWDEVFGAEDLPKPGAELASTLMRFSKIMINFGMDMVEIGESLGNQMRAKPEVSEKNRPDLMASMKTLVEPGPMFNAGIGKPPVEGQASSEGGHWRAEAKNSDDPIVPIRIFPQGEEHSAVQKLEVKSKPLVNEGLLPLPPNIEPLMKNEIQLVHAKPLPETKEPQPAPADQPKQLENKPVVEAKAPAPMLVPERYKHSDSENPIRPPLPKELKDWKGLDYDKVPKMSEEEINSAYAKVLMKVLYEEEVRTWKKNYSADTGAAAAVEDQRSQAKRYNRALVA